MSPRSKSGSYVTKQEISSFRDGKVQDLFTSVRNLRNKAIPSDLEAQFKKAKKLRENDDLVGSIIDTQLEFGNRGTQFYMKNKRARQKFTPIIEKFNLLGLNEQMWNSMCTYSNIVLHWKMKTDVTVDYVNVLNPYDLEIIPTINNKSVVYLRVPEFLKKLANAGTLNTEERKLLNSFPKKYIDAARSRTTLSVLSKKAGMVLLNNDDNEYWLIANLDGFSDRMTPPRMRQIFDSVENRDMLIDGDYSVAFMIKNFIMQVKAGESITSGPKAGSTQNWAKKVDLDGLKKEFNALGKAIWLFTNHTVEIDSHFPDTKIFDPIKYQSPDARIMTWGGVGKILMLGDGSNFAAGFINLKRLIAKVKKYREGISRVWDEFFLHTTIKGDIAKSNMPKLIYDDSLLKEAGIDLKEKTFLLDRGALSKQTALIKAGYDPDIEEQNKEEELEKGDLYLPTLTSMMPIEEAVNKVKEKQDPGRPGNEVPTRGGDTMNAPQNPKPSTTASEDAIVFPKDVFSAILERSDDAEKELASLIKLPFKALNIWVGNYRESIKNSNHLESARHSWASVRQTYKRSKGRWIEKVG